MHYLNLEKDNWTITDEISEDNTAYKKYQHKDTTLYICVEYNEVENMLRFSIRDGDLPLGNGHQHVNKNDYDVWVNNFIYQGNFNVWISNKRLKAF